MTLEKFQRPEEIEANSSASRKWFRKKAKGMVQGGMNRTTLLRDGLDPSNPYNFETMTPMPGKMYMFMYQPKGANTLEFYDKFPLVILVDTVKGGFEGLNLHYLPMSIRQKFFYGGLLKTTSNKDFDESTRFKVTYESLKNARSLKAFRPCFKRYLTGYIRGSIVMIPSDEWEMAIHLPTSDFAKKDESYVHQKSKEMIGRF
jgi:hypothetical protein